MRYPIQKPLTQEELLEDRGLNRFQTYFPSKLIFTVLSQLKTLVYKLDPTH